MGPKWTRVKQHRNLVSRNKSIPSAPRVVAAYPRAIESRPAEEILPRKPKKTNNNAPFAPFDARELNSAMDEDERSLKRRRTIPTIASSASPPASDFQLQQEKAAQPSEEEIARRLVEQQEQAILKAEEARLKAEEAELEERHRTWNDFTDEYHDSKHRPAAHVTPLTLSTVVLELPLEYERNFTLLEELEETQQGQFTPALSQYRR